MPDNIWAIRDVPEQIRKLVKLYAVEHDVTMAQAVEALVSTALAAPGTPNQGFSPEVTVRADMLVINLRKQGTAEDLRAASHGGRVPQELHIDNQDVVSWYRDWIKASVGSEVVDGQLVRLDPAAAAYMFTQLVVILSEPNDWRHLGWLKRLRLTNEEVAVKLTEYAKDKHLSPQEALEELLAQAIKARDVDVARQKLEQETKQRRQPRQSTNLTESLTRGDRDQ